MHIILDPLDSWVSNMSKRNETAYEDSNLVNILQEENVIAILYFYPRTFGSPCEAKMVRSRSNG